jgi:sugar (pentulose or hexulose) kinase
LPLLVGVDVGTTMTKAAVVDLDGRELAHGSARTPWRSTAEGIAADPGALLNATAAALDVALAQTPDGSVIGVGVTSVAESVVLLGADGKPLADAIVWHDPRGEDEVPHLVEALGERAFAEHTGMAPSAICTIAKLRWLACHGLGRPQRALSIADWIVQRMGGSAAIDFSHASRTGAFDIGRRTWWLEALDWAGMPADLFPQAVPAGSPRGRANGRLHERLRGATLTSAGHDDLCAAASVGATGPDQLLDSCGTGEAFVRASPPLPPGAVGDIVERGLTVSCHTLPARHALLGGQSLGLVLRGVLDLVGVDDDPAANAALDEQAAGGAGPLRLVREAAFAPSSLAGVGPGVSPGLAWAAALEAVTLGAADVFARMEAAAGPVDDVLAIGGWSRRPALRERREQLFARISYPAVVEAGARGAALFSGCAAGCFRDPHDFPPVAWLGDPPATVEPVLARQQS